MIVKLTDHDREELKALEATYDRKINEQGLLIEKLRPDDKEPSIEDYDEWLSSGSQEWRDARIEYFRLMDEKTESLHTFYKNIERREFSKLGDDREKILQSARDQVVLLIEGRFKQYKTKIDTHTDEDGDEITAFSARDLRVDGDHIYLDIETLISDCKRSLLTLHYDALAEDQEATREIDDIVLTLVTDSPLTSSDKGELGATFTIRTKKRKSRSKKSLPVFSETDSFSMFSTTQLKNVIYSLLSHDGDATRTAQSIKAISKSASVSKSKTAVRVRTRNSDNTIELLASSQGSTKGRTTKKILHFIESKMYESLYYKGHMNNYLIIFSLRDLVDKGLYSNEKIARRAFNDASLVLTAIRVTANIRTKKNEIINLAEDEVDGEKTQGSAILYPAMWIENGICHVALNHAIDWSPYLRNYTYLPDSWYTLPDKSADLEFRVFDTIRQHKMKVDKSGSLTVNIKLSTVAEWLDLPLTVRNQKRDVKVPIETAVKRVKESLDPNNFKIEIVTDLNAPLEEYLSGYLKVTASGIYTENLIGLAEKQQERIEKAIARRDEIVKEASIRALSETHST